MPQHRRKIEAAQTMFPTFVKKVAIRMYAGKIIAQWSIYCLKSSTKKLSKT